MELPNSFAEEMQQLLGAADAQHLFAAIKQDPPISIRMNQAKVPANYLFEQPLEKQESVAWCQSGYYLKDKLTYTFDPLFHNGGYYVQEASSMFLAQVMSQFINQPNTVMLDLCAAPGGKSTLARTYLPTGSLLVANEVIRTRTQVLAENLTKWGYDDVMVTNNDPVDFAALGGFFDVILADVPCSGEGMFRKDPKSINEWSLENVDNCAKRQRRIINDVWPSLKEDGILIYSTCTYNSKEDEENIQWIIENLGAESLEVTISNDWDITSNLIGEMPHVYRFFPGHTRGEGFFMAVLRKKSEATPIPIFKEKVKKGEKAIAVPKEIQSWLRYPETYYFENNGNSITAMQQQQKQFVNLLRKYLRVIQWGIRLAELKGKDFIPTHALALNLKRNKDTFPTVELTYQQAIAYLRKESLQLSPDAPHGHVLATYLQLPLGFLKNIGNRANNLYPQEWKIRSGYLPKEIKCL